MTSSSASSPSLNRYILQSPELEDAAASVTAACFNPLFIHTASNAAHINHNHRHNLNHNSLAHNSGISISHKSTNNSLSQNPTNTISSGNFVLLKESGTSHSKLTANTSSGSMQPGAPSTPSRKVHVVYYLSRSGQLEHPHLLEVSIPPNQGLYLRDVKRRLAVIRGKRLPLTFAWSYKRSYKNGYVWQDLCDDDLIFPAHGCEYVLKGSEILNDQRNTAEEESVQPANADTRSSIRSDGAQEEQALISRDPKVVFYDESARVARPTPLHVGNMVESGTDATTQTEEEPRPVTDDDPHDDQVQASKGLYIKHEGLELAKHSSSFSPQRGSCTTTQLQNAIELNKAEIASPPSSSSATNSPSPYKEIASTSSSSTSVGNRSGEHVNLPTHELIKSGSKTPGRPWMKKAIQKLEEQGGILCIHETENGGASGENGIFASNESASSKGKDRSMAANSVASVIMEEGEQSPAVHVRPTRGKHSSALSLLQFMSCGGLDIKEQILPMSLYRLRSKGTPGTASQLHMSNYVLSPEHSDAESFVTYGGSESGKSSWAKLGKPKSLCLNGSVSKPIFKLSGEFMSGESDPKNQHGHRHYVHSMQANSLSPVAKVSTAKAQGASIPDVISIGRSSISDRSTNASHELEYQASNVHARLKKSGEVANTCNNAVKGSPRCADARPEVSTPLRRNNEGVRPAMGALSARAVSGEVLMSKGSPLFVPGKRHLSYSGTPLNYVGGGMKPNLSESISISPLQAHDESGNNAMGVAKQDADNKSAILCSNRSCNPSRAFSDGEVSCMLANRNTLSKSGDQRSMTINGYDQSMAQIWEELLIAAPTSMAEEHQQKGADFRRVRQVTMGSSSSAWEAERTLQNAVELSLQLPLEHHLLHVDCAHCGKKVKAELMKAHVKSCSCPPKSPANVNSTATKASNINCLSLNASLGKSPKSDSNLCQRFLRASPPPPPTCNAQL
ncbi:hypothetical protein GOP47_0012362 [Adiantum capillus-veneris]|uniref:SOSEKI DIX-like domain-containing protein n=1 Tax=Adiantum capillus-veneris TaxID=13818 RepID=A0A9D4UR84_ADICA|nr:hypothetical protein GOP47_0012362 [Adiantum capillus-veneris]